MISKRYLKENSNIGKEMMLFLSNLFPINRSITGKGNRLTLKEIKKISNLLKIQNSLMDGLEI